MKLRIRDNSIRLRLTQIEVEAVGREGVVKARVSVPGDTGLDYVLESSADISEPTARYSDGALTVIVPETAVQQWVSTEQVSIAADETLDDGEVLKILVEKDYACLAPREGEDESDMFPHPLAGKN